MDRLSRRSSIAIFVTLIVLQIAIVGLPPQHISWAESPSAPDSGDHDPAVYNPETGHWYQYVDAMESWHAARDHCVALGGYLVTIGSATENDFVYGLYPWNVGWLGATDEVEEGVWRWVTGEPWAYTNWAPGEPNNCSDPDCKPEHYLEFDSNHPYRWNDIPHNLLPFVCEFDFPPAPDVELVVEGTKDPLHPMTTYEVILEAVLADSDGYEIEKVSWTGDLTPGEGNPYTYRPDPRDHGLKRIEAIVTYREIESGILGQASVEHEFKLFFEKEQVRPGATDPNWFQYWGEDGAVPGLDRSDVDYDDKPGVGEYKRKEDTIYLYRYAAYYDVPVDILSTSTCPGASIPGAAGIDLAAAILIHENRHQEVYHAWFEPNALLSCGYPTGPWGGCTDSDSGIPTANHDDSLPDAYEMQVGTAIDNVDSCDLGTLLNYPKYSLYGDEEYVARKAELSAVSDGAKDWANPGAQTDPPFMSAELQEADRVMEGIDRRHSGPLNDSIPSGEMLEIGPLAQDLATLTGNYTDSGVDQDHDGLYDLLRIGVELDVSFAGEYAIIGFLQDSAGSDVARADQVLTLSDGVQTAQLDFDGHLLQRHEGDGPYRLAHVQLGLLDRSVDTTDWADDAYTTSMYTSDQFAPSDVTFTGAYGSQPADTNGDGLYELLNMPVEVEVHESGAYTLIGWLYDGADDLVTGAEASAAISASGTYTLAFDGRAIRWNRTDGPYSLRDLEVRDVDDERVSSVDLAHTSAFYSYDEFQHDGASIDASTYVDSGLDVTGDSLFDFLRLTFAIRVDQAGSYRVLVTLTDSEGGVISDLDRVLDLEVGANDITVDFPGDDIFEHGVDGPYSVAWMTLLDDDGIIDYQKLAHSTQAFSYTDFVGAHRRFLPMIVR